MLEYEDALRLDRALAGDHADFPNLRIRFGCSASFHFAETPLDLELLESRSGVLPRPFVPGCHAWMDGRGFGQDSAQSRWRFNLEAASQFLDEPAFLRPVRQCPNRMGGG